LRPGPDRVCYLNGQPFKWLPGTTYRVTAVDGRLDIQIVDGPSIGRGLTLDASNTVRTEYRVSDTESLCFNVQPEYVFDYTFTFHTNGTGAATARWSYGVNTNCATCTVDDSATLSRIAGPGS
jgi:hypothetical protein